MYNSEETMQSLALESGLGQVNSSLPSASVYLRVTTLAGKRSVNLAIPRLQWRLRGWSFVWATVLALLCLALAEGALRLFGYGYSTRYFIPSSDGEYLEPNRQFGWQFFPHESAIVPEPARLRVHKTPGTLRVFILGESAAAGAPAPSFGFGRILELMLRQQFPDAKFEMVNVAMRGIN